MCKSGLETFFTPVYERTEIRKGFMRNRSLIGRNIRGLHAEQYQGDLTDVRNSGSRTGVYQSRTDLYPGGNVSQQCC